MLRPGGVRWTGKFGYGCAGECETDGGSVAHVGCEEVVGMVDRLEDVASWVGYDLRLGVGCQEKRWSEGAERDLRVR